MSYREGLIEKIISLSGYNLLLGKGLPMIVMLVLYAILGLIVASMIDSGASDMKIAVDKSFAYRAFYPDSANEMTNYNGNRIEDISAVVQEAKNK